MLFIIILIIILFGLEYFISQNMYEVFVLNHQIYYSLYTAIALFAVTMIAWIVNLVRKNRKIAV